MYHTGQIVYDFEEENPIALLDFSIYMGNIHSICIFLTIEGEIKAYPMPEAWELTTHFVKNYDGEFSKDIYAPTVSGDLVDMIAKLKDVKKSIENRIISPSETFEGGMEREKRKKIQWEKDQKIAKIVRKNDPRWSPGEKFGWFYNPRTEFYPTMLCKRCAEYDKFLLDKAPCKGICQLCEGKRGGDVFKVIGEKHKKEFSYSDLTKEV